jgi:predicted metalloprotease
MTDIDLIKACIQRGVTPEDYTSAYVHMQESYHHLLDEAYGYSEQGRHGKQSDRQEAANDVTVKQ